MTRFIYTLFVIVFITACGNNKTTPLVMFSSEALADSLPGECPYLIKDVKGNTVLSWVRRINDSTTAFCYAVSKDGKIFGNPVVIPNSTNIQPHGENIPKLIFKPSGEIIALWGSANPNAANKYSGLVYYVQSFDDGKTWTNPKPLVNDTAGYDQRYYDVALLPNGEACAIWLDNRKTTSKEGSALFFASTAGKNGFQNEKLISESCCQCCRTDLFVDKKGSIHAVYRGILQDSIRDMVHIVSNDGGNHFSQPSKISDDNWVIDGCPHTGPAMAETEGQLHFAWFTGGHNSGCYYASSKDNGNNFTPRDMISKPGSHPQMASSPKGDVFVVWDEPVEIDKKYYKRILIQKRNEQGGSNIDFITQDTTTTSYPVLASINEKDVLVAYIKKNGNKNYVVRRLVSY